MYIFLNLYFAPYARGGTRLDGARDNKQFWSLAPACLNLRSLGSNCNILKKVLVTLLGLFGVPRSDSALPWWFGAWGIVPLLPPPLYAPAPCIHKLQSCINTAPLPKALSRACYASTTKHYDKTVVLWHDITRGSDIATEQERTLAISTRPRPSHDIRKDNQSVLLHFRQEDQNLASHSESGGDEFKSVAVRIWLLRKQLLLRSYRFTNYCGPCQVYETSSMATSVQ